MRNWTSGIAQSVLGIGMIASGPVLTMIISPEKFGASYVYGVTDGLLVAFGIMHLLQGLQITSSKNDVGG